jgi:methylenetetrahydrofolate reductase (NADPH)
MDDQKRRGIGQRIREGERSFSFELFPTKEPEGEEKLWRAIRQHHPYQPTYVSVT